VYLYYILIIFTYIYIFLQQALRFNYRIFNVQGYELRIKALTEDLGLLRKTLGEREDQIANLRVEVHKSTTRIIDYKDSEDYRTLQRSYELLFKQLEEERKESARLREVTEKLRSEIIIVRQDTDKSVREGYELRIRQMMDELASVRKTVVERDEAITKLRFEVQTSTRVVSFKDSEDYLVLKRQYDMAQAQLESERRETARLMQVIESLRTEVGRRDTDKGARDSLELRLKQATDELAVTRKSLIEKEEQVSQMRVEVRQSTDRFSRVKESEEYMAMIRQVDVLKKTIEELNINISRLHADNDKLRDEVHIVRTERRKSETVYESKVKVLEEDLLALRQKLLDRENEISKLRISSVQTGEVESSRKEVMRLTQLIDTLRLDLSNARREVDESRSKLTLVSSDSSTYTTRISELEAIVARQRKELAGNDELISSLRQQVRETSERITISSSSSSEMASLRLDLERAVRENRELRDQISRLQLRIKELEAQLETYMSQKTTTTTEVVKMVSPELESEKSSSHEVSFKISPEEYAAMMAAQSSSTTTTTVVTKTVSFGGDDVVVIDDQH
jgi:chromosome segregation ATPase